MKLRACLVAICLALPGCFSGGDRVVAGATLAEKKIGRAAGEIADLASDVAALASAAQGPALELTALLGEVRADYQGGRVVRVLAGLVAAAFVMVIVHGLVHGVIATVAGRKAAT